MTEYLGLIIYTLLNVHLSLIFTALAPRPIQSISCNVFCMLCAVCPLYYTIGRCTVKFNNAMLLEKIQTICRKVLQTQIACPDPIKQCYVQKQPQAFAFLRSNKRHIRGQLGAKTRARFLALGLMTLVLKIPRVST